MKDAEIGCVWRENIFLKMVEKARLEMWRRFIFLLKQIDTKTLSIGFLFHLF